MSAPVNVEREALAVLATKGWGQLGRFLANDSVCLAMAVSAVPVEDREQTWDAIKRVSGVIAEQFPERTREHGWSSSVLWHFNDHPDTTIDDVVMVLEKAALRRDETAGVAW